MLGLRFLRCCLLYALLTVPGANPGCRAADRPPDPSPPPANALSSDRAPSREPLPDGFPNSTNTGPIPGTVFKSFVGEYEVRQDGELVDGLRVTGSISVYANDVTIQNCEVDASGQMWGISQISGSGLKVKNCRIYGGASRTDREATHVLHGVANAAEVSFTEIYGVENAITGGSTHIHNNYIHGFARWIAADDHTDGIQTYGWSGAGGLRVIRNTIIAVTTGGDYSPAKYGAGSSAVALSEGMHNLTIEGNFFAGGTYTLYGPSQRGSAPANVHVIGNRFSRRFFPKCGYFGTHTGFNRDAPGFLWSGNVWHETGRTIGP